MQIRRLFLLASLGALSVLPLTGCMSVDLMSLLQPELEEITLQKPRTWTPDRILVLDVSGIISAREAGTFSFIDRCSPDTIMARLTRAAADDRIKGVVLRIDTPGGGVSATDMIHHEVSRFRRKTGLPVYAVIMGMGCSGGYYVANAAERIYAHPTSVTGSIGVIATFPRFRQLADKIGYDQIVIKSGTMKDLGNPLREMPEEERKVLQDMIDSFYETFLEKVAAGRSRYESKEALRGIADGRIYTAQQALELNLIDRIGYLRDAIQDVMTAAGISDARVITFSHGGRKDATIYSATRGRHQGLPLINVSVHDFLGTTGPGFFYMWMPGAR